MAASAVTLTLLMGLHAAASSISTETRVEVGQYKRTYVDASRKKEVEALIYYPTPTDRTQSYPLIVLAHCLFGAENWYTYLADALVPRGYIIASLGTYQYDLFVSSEMLAVDQQFLMDSVLHEAGINTSSPIYRAINGSRVSVTGHSLGGGSTLIVSARNGTFLQSMLTMSAEIVPKYPSQINIPSLVMTGTQDCICPAKIHGLPIYKGLASKDKYFVNLVNATHCHFDQVPPLPDDACSVVETADGCHRGGQILPREKQFALVVKYASLWFDFTLKHTVSEDELIRQLNADAKVNAVQFLQN